MSGRKKKQERRENREIIGKIINLPKSDDPLEKAYASLVVNDFVYVDSAMQNDFQSERIQKSIKELIRLGFLEYIDGTENLPWDKRKFKTTAKGREYVEKKLRKDGN